jgi:riboflavin synthase
MTTTMQVGSQLRGTAGCGCPRRNMASMFTGIIEHVGRIAAVTPRPAGARLTIELGPVADGVRLGDSIACDGVCLTAAELTGTTAAFDVSAETLRKTTLGSWRAGKAVNLERALRLGDRLGGHLVSGHVDGVGRLEERRREGDGERFTFLLPESGVQVVEKGSLAVDGISLTTWDCRGRRASVALIPHTLERTTLGGLRAGAAVNLEQDLLGRWVERLLTERGHG